MYCLSSLFVLLLLSSFPPPFSLPLQCHQILDFGLARATDQEMTGYVATRYWRAPEIMLNWMHYGMEGRQFAFLANTPPATWLSLLCVFYSWHVVCGLHHGWATHWSSSFPRHRPYPLTPTHSDITWLATGDHMTCHLGSHDLPLGITWLVIWGQMTCHFGSHDLPLGITWRVIWGHMAR